MKPEIKLALETLANQLMIVDAKLPSAIDHERELRILHGHAFDRLESLKLQRHNLQVEAVKIKATAAINETT